VSRHAFGALALAFALVAAPAAAAVEPAGEPEGASSRSDCRYLVTEDRPASRTQGRYGLRAFPQDDIFRPLLADPKQPQFFAAYQRARLRSAHENVNAGFVGFGEYFGLVAHRPPSGCNGVQLGLSGGVFAQFNLDTPSADLINADYVVGLPVSFRRGALSARLRIYHQSSHVGDEFLLGTPGFRRLNLSFEEVDLLGSWEWRWARLYAGGGVLVNKEPSTLRGGKLQWGGELRGKAYRAPLAAAIDESLGDVRLTPVLGADFKAFEEQDWATNAALAGGVEWSSERSARRLRLLVTYYRGYNPYGQFFNEKIELLGLGLYFAF
jgi:hypothetical protein